ncbi:replication-relaxation family protein [Siminovitchia sediminis]|uniref:Replication-relaxation family protein n=1 Tax=Siminovitchia sediminis TaxID=1274353 RepID=A0ABW4KN30_9BACI
MFPSTTDIKIINNLNMSGVYLKKVDMDLLLFLYEQKMLSTEQLYRFHVLIQPIDRKRISRKLTKFEKNGLVVKNSHVLYKRAGLKLNMFRLGLAGLRLLSRFGLIEEGQTTPRLHRNIDHYIGIKHVLLDVIEIEKDRVGTILAEGGKFKFWFQEEESQAFFDTNLKVKLYPKLKKEESQSDLQSISDYKNKIKERIPAFSKKDILISIAPPNFPLYRKDENGYHLLPDWTLLMNKHVFHVEVDASTERISSSSIDGVTSIESKFFRYIFIAKMEPNKIHNVLFVSLDDSTSLRKNYGTKDIRIGNLKREIARLKEVFQPNLNVFFLRLERVKELWPFLIEKATGAYDEEKLSKIVEVSLDLNRNHFPFDVRFINTQSELEKIILNPRGFNYPVEQLYILKKRMDIESLNLPSKQLLIPIFMLEGDMYGHELITYYSQRIAAGSLPVNTKVLAVYYSKKSMLEDVLRQDTVFQHVLLVNIEEIQWFREPAKIYSSKGKKLLTFE